MRAVPAVRNSGIVLWGLSGDDPLAAVRDALRWRGQAPFFLDQGAILRTEVELTIGSALEGRVRAGDTVIDLDAVTAVYLRPYDARQLPCVIRAGHDSPAWRHAVNVEEALLSWIELAPALVINQPSAMATNSSKPYQAALIRLYGFEIPDTLITTDPTAALEFWQRHDTVVYKSTSGIRSVVSRLVPADMERLENVVFCPTQFQQYVPGTDYRVHVVGHEVFACKIVSEADDYRYATRRGAITTIHPFDLPEEIADRCRALAASLHMLVVGIDLRCTAEEQWYCFEVNPSPGFTYFQQAAHQPIDDAIARLLISARAS